MSYNFWMVFFDDYTGFASIAKTRYWYDKPHYHKTFKSAYNYADSLMYNWIKNKEQLQAERLKSFKYLLKDKENN